MTELRPFVSIRKYIKWGDRPAGEDTDTVVLTSKNKHFVDIRIYKHTDEVASASTANNSHYLPIERLEWGFAGRAHSTPAIFSYNGQLEKPAHTEWEHWVDSKTIEVVRDEGDMFPRENTNEVVERGAMVNPSTGNVEDYEECWEDLEIAKVGGEDLHVSWVLRMESSSRGSETESNIVRGMVIRIGEWIEGVLRTSDGVSVVRWKWEAPTGWQRVLEIGKLEVIPELFDERQISVGQLFKVGDDMNWECIESFSWT